MLTTTMPGLIRLGSARSQTRADHIGEKMELNPVLRYDDAGARAEVVRLGGAAAQTRADSPTGTFELIPIERWEVAGVRAH